MIENITALQANQYIQSRYVSVNPLRVNWDILTDEEKQIFINQSYDEIKQLWLKANINLEIVNDAIAENALAIVDRDINATANMQRKTLHSLGELKADKQATETNIALPITGEKAYRMLKPYIGFVGVIL